MPFEPAYGDALGVTATPLAAKNHIYKNNYMYIPNGSTVYFCGRCCYPFATDKCYSILGKGHKHADLFLLTDDQIKALKPVKNTDHKEHNNAV